MPPTPTETLHEPLHRALACAVHAANAPGAVACVGDTDSILFLDAFGLQQCTPRQTPTHTDTLYDLASLTKVIATTTAVMLLFEQGRLDLDEPIGKRLGVGEPMPYTPRQLLTHTAGLPATVDWYHELHGLAAYVEKISTLGATPSMPPRRLYSDLGFMLLAQLVTVLTDSPLDQFCQAHIFEPLGMKNTFFGRVPEPLKSRCAPTEECPWRQRLVHGEVHDENAYAIGGVSGHAGLFSTAEDLAAFCRALLNGRILRLDTLKKMTDPNTLPFYPWQGLGWKRDPWFGGSEGFLPTRSAFGHTGWTGTSLWLDPERGLFVILLSNTCHPTRKKRNNTALRRIFHAAVAHLLYPETANTHTGLDRLMWDNFDAIKGKRIGVLCHAASVDSRSKHLLDILTYSPGTQLRHVFSPEHGFQTSTEAGAPVEDAEISWNNQKVPATSLYGKRHAPTPDMLRDMDALVIDLQDVGARFYTYPHTLMECMKACAAADVPVILLDRPNPINGTQREGICPEQVGSPVCALPIPIRHGMTLGEIAQWIKAHMLPEVNLTVLEMDYWPRDFFFPQCQLPWVPPSPNMRNFETALLYPGTCLFEGTNLNEGRGTDAPFLVIGAPWLEPQKVLDALPPRYAQGVTPATVTYVPRSQPGRASHPRYEGEGCRGIQITVTDPRRVTPVAFGVALIHAVHSTHPSRFEFLPSFDILAGGTALREKISRNAPLEEIIAEWTKPNAAALPALYTTYEELLQSRNGADACT